MSITTRNSVIKEMPRVGFYASIRGVCIKKFRGRI